MFTNIKARVEVGVSIDGLCSASHSQTGAREKQRRKKEKSKKKQNVLLLISFLPFWSFEKRSFCMLASLQLNTIDQNWLANLSSLFP